MKNLVICDLERLLCVVDLIQVTQPRWRLDVSLLFNSIRTAKFGSLWYYLFHRLSSTATSLKWKLIVRFLIFCSRRFNALYLFRTCCWSGNEPPMKFLGDKFLRLREYPHLLLIFNKDFDFFKHIKFSHVSPKLRRHPEQLLRHDYIPGAFRFYSFDRLYLSGIACWWLDCKLYTGLLQFDEFAIMTRGWARLLHSKVLMIP